jgi:hypothetical protein
MSNSAEIMTEYTVDAIRKKYKTFREAKAAFNVKARSWLALVEKLNAPTYEELKAQLNKLQKDIDFLRNENETLKKSISKTEDFDEIGFWLLDNNFDRSRFADFDVPPEALRIESAAKAFYKKLAQKYHPDKGGTEMQMSNLNRLYEQMMALVDMNDGVGK